MAHAILVASLSITAFFPCSAYIGCVEAADAFHRIQYRSSSQQHRAQQKKTLFFRKKQIIFSHGDRSDSIYYVEKGTVKLTLASANGKEAFIGLLDGGDLFGESCLASDRPVRFHTAAAVTDVQVFKIDRLPMICILRANPEFAYGFITYLLGRNAQIQEDLVNNLLNSSEERLARVLSSLARLVQSLKVSLPPASASRIWQT